MAEVLGLATSVIAVIELSAKVTLLCSQYLKDVKNAQNDIAKLQGEINSLKTVSEGVRRLLDTPQAGQLKTSQGLRAALESGQNQLQSLKDTLQSNRDKNKKWWKLHALSWPFKSNDITELVQELARHTQVISSSLQVDQTAILLDMNQRIVLDKLPVVESAIFDSHAEEHNPTCLQGTRTDILEIVRNWADIPQTKALFWLNGMAGTGKSTISRTVAHFFSKNGQLGASFFFKRGESDRGRTLHFFPTIAAQLVKREPALAPHIKTAIDSDPDIFGKKMEEQFEKLVLEPLFKLPQEKRENKIFVIIVDALDECEQEDDIRLLIKLLSRVNHEQLLKLRIFVTSRPELPIRLGFSTIKGTFLDLTLHSIPESVVEDDLKAYFTHELAKIQCDYNNTVSQDRKLPPHWPGRAAIEDLARMASPLFIFAATVCRFLADRRNGTPDTKLRKVLQYKTRSQESKLDATYLPVLDQMTVGLSDREADETLDEFRMIVGSIIVLMDLLSTSALAAMLDMPQNTIDGRLDLLHSVLSIPSSPKLPIKLLHLSFRDFLLDPEKRGKNKFWIDEQQAHRQLVKCCLRILNTSLRKDMCEVRWPGTSRESIDPQVINEKLPPEVQYACQYWIDHLEQSGDRIHDGDEVHDFLKLHLLHWLEALDLLEGAYKPTEGIDRLASLVQDRYSSELSDFLSDSEPIALQIRHRGLPLQVYSDAALCDWNSNRPHESDLPDWILPLPELEMPISNDTQFLVNAISMPIAISSDSRHLAAVSFEKYISVWSVDTGSLLHTLGHEEFVGSIAFSPDAKLLASASFDWTVRIWSVETGRCLQTSPLPSPWEYKVSFDDDGQFVLTKAGAILIDNELQPAGPSATPKEPFVPTSGLTLFADTDSHDLFLVLEGLRFHLLDYSLWQADGVAVGGSVVAIYDIRRRRICIFRIDTERLLELSPSV
ncbi:hypothetical protein F4818DRAFT_345854 [Hypoxylon cercidicola]|nr:hypothetical protein F4818DRAFT_345854 [Hypoxylon cercidicola]